MKRMYLKRKRKKHNILNYITLLIIFIIIFLIYMLNIFNKKAIPQLLNYSEIETKKIVSSVINSTVINQTYNNINFDNLFITTKDSYGNIQAIDFNPNYVNKILVDTYNSVQENIMDLENGNVEKLKLNNINLSKYDNNKLKKGIIYEIPSGLILDNVLFNNILPKIPVKMDLIGNIFCRLDTSVKSYGINNAIITVNIVVDVEVKILLPFVSKSTKITEMPNNITEQIVKNTNWNVGNEKIIKRSIR